MTTDAQALPDGAVAAGDETAVVQPVALEDATRWRILFYLAALILIGGFGAPQGGLIDIPISFFLKNKLHLDAPQVALFRLASGVPLYGSFLFGFVRDTWNPFGMRDRGYLVIFGVVCSAIYVAFAFSSVSYWTLLAAVVVLTCAYSFVSSASNGLTATLGQQHVMSGQVSTVFNVVASVPIIAALVAGGYLSDFLEHSHQGMRILFLTGAVVMAMLALYGLWRPKVVYDNVHAELGPKSHPLHDIARLFGYWPIYPALLIWLLWNFAPGAATPLQFFLQNELHAPDSVYSNWNAIFAASFLPTFFLYGWLCTRYPLRPLLFWGAVVAVPQMVPLLFIHTPSQALIAAFPIGLMGGVCSAAYTDLLIRSCPRGLQGTILMFSVSLYWVASRFGDILGTWLYARFHGFTVCVIAITIV